MSRSEIESGEGLPSEIADLFKQLWNQVAGLHFYWAALTRLFNGDPKRVWVLQNTAPAFFGLVRHSLQDSVVLSIARITDLESLGRFRNASLAALVTASRALVCEPLAAELDRDLKQVGVAAKSVRERRNRVVAHLDAPTVLSTDPDPLPGVTRAEFEAVLALIRSLMNKIESRFRRSTTAYDTSVAHGDADHLVFYLEQALAAENEERRKRGLKPLE